MFLSLFLFTVGMFTSCSASILTQWNVGQIISPDEILVNPSQTTFALQQQDGNFCLYNGQYHTNLGRIKCSSVAPGKGYTYYAVLLDTGTFCTYKEGVPIWCYQEPSLANYYASSTLSSDFYFALNENGTNWFIGLEQKQLGYGLQVLCNPFTARNNQGSAPDWSSNTNILDQGSNWILSSDSAVWETSKSGWYQVSWTVLIPQVQLRPYTINTWVETGNTTDTTNPFSLELFHMQSNTIDTSIATWSQKVDLRVKSFLRVLVYQNSGQDVIYAQALLSVEFLHN